MSTRWIAAFFLSALAMGAVHARADVAPPSPESIECVRGAQGTLPTVPGGTLDSRGRPARAWPYCAPTTCASDADCTGGRVCSAEEIGLCVEDQTSVGEVTVRAARERGCEPDGSCLNLQSACERARRCVVAEVAAPTPVSDPAPPPPPPPAPPAPPAAAVQSSWGCRAASGSTSSMAVAWIPLALLALRRLRR